MYGTIGFKLTECKVDYISKGYYKFNLNGNTFDCKWCSSWYDRKNNTVRFYFRNNKILENKGYCVDYGVPLNFVKYANSLNFGSGDEIINCLWVLGEVLEKKNSYDYY